MTESSITRREVLGSLGSLGVMASTGLGSPMQPASPRPADAAARRAELYALLGKLPDRTRPVSGQKLKEEERDGYILETWRYDLNGPGALPVRPFGRATYPGTGSSPLRS